MKDNYSKKSNTGFILIVISLCLIIASLLVVIIFFDEFKGVFNDDESAPSLAPSITAASPTPSATELAPPTEMITPSPSPTKRPDEVVVANKTVGTRFTAPEGFERVAVEAGSFAEYLRAFGLKDYGVKPQRYDSSTKTMVDLTDASIAGVFDIALINIGSLQGAAGSMIRLRAEYLRSKGAIENISFELCTTPAFVCDYKTWIEGGRLDKTQVDQDILNWCTDHGENGEVCGHKDVTLGDVDSSFRYYLQQVMLYSNVASLKLQMRKISTSDLQIGDVFCSQAGTALMIVDVAVNRQTGEKMFIVAGGATPATDIHVYDNSNDTSKNVWQTLESNGSFICNGVVYSAESLYRFR